MDMTQMIIDILFYTGLSLLWTNAEPLIYLKRFFGFKEETYDDYQSKIKQFIHRLIYCTYCSSFWITLICTQSLTVTILVTLCIYIIENKL